jgi:hypothetical protein
MSEVKENRLKKRLRDKTESLKQEQDKAQNTNLVALSVLLDRDGKYQFVLQDPEGVAKVDPFITLGMAAALQEATVAQFSPVLQRLTNLERAVSEVVRVLSELLQDEEGPPETSNGVDPV